MNETTLYTRRLPGEEIRSISGYYRVMAEGVVSVDGREAIYVLTGCELDSSCCGPAGVAEIVVPGFIVSGTIFDAEVDTGVVEVERIRDEKTKGRVTGALREKYPSHIGIVFE